MVANRDDDPPVNRDDPRYQHAYQQQLAFLRGVSDDEILAAQEHAYANYRNVRHDSDLSETQKIIHRAQADACADAIEEAARGRPLELVKLATADAEREPGPTSPKLPEPAPFPVDALPKPARSLVADGAAALGVSSDMVGVPLLGIAGGIIGNTYRIELKPGYEERANLWPAVVNPPGSGKTPALNIARAPMEALQREAAKAHKEALERYKAQLADWERGEKRNRGQKPTPPRLREYYVSDATLEAIHAVHAHEPGLSLIRDELLGWVKSHDMYRGGKGGDRSNWLSLWSGGAIKVNRRHAQEDGPAYIPDPVICVVGGIQPDMLPELAEEAGRQDGFLDRILWSYPDAQPLKWTEATLDPKITNAVRKVFRKLRRDEPATHPVTLTSVAKETYVAWHNENAEAVGRTYGLVQGVYAKLPTQLARLCLVLHCLAYPDNPPATLVSAETMGDAIELVEYFRAHAHRVLPAFGSAAEQRAVGLRARILRALNREPGAWVNRSDVFTRLGHHAPAAKVNAELRSLEEAGAVESRPGPSGNKGGRPPTQWRTKTQEHKNPENAWGEL